MNGLVLGAWIGAVVVAVLVLGFSAYELTWKARRLQTDVRRLVGLSETLSMLQADLRAAQRRFVREPPVSAAPSGSPVPLVSPSPLGSPVPRVSPVPSAVDR